MYVSYGDESVLRETIELSNHARFVNDLMYRADPGKVNHYESVTYPKSLYPVKVDAFIRFFFETHMH